VSTTPSVERDERTVAVENARYRWAHILVNYALLIDVVYRGMVRDEAAWDLLALVLVSGAVCTVYQARKKTLSRRWVLDGLLVACVAAAIALAVTLLLLGLR